MRNKKAFIVVIALLIFSAVFVIDPLIDKRTASENGIVSEVAEKPTETVSLDTPSSPDISADVPAAVSGLLSVHFIDVDNADAILVECDGSFALIDAGENNQGALVLGYLSEQSVSELEFAIGTHPHSDHIGGMDMVLSDIYAKRIYMPDAPHTTKTYSDLLSVIESRGIELVVPTVGDVFYLGDASFTVLSPARDYSDLNDDSIVVRIVYGGTSFLLAGDATRLAEADMLDSGLTLSSDILKVGHHGSNTSSSYIFLREVMPRYTVITCGAGNQYGHPHEEVISRLNDLQKVHGTEMFRSDTNGTIVITSDGSEITVSTESSQTSHYQGAKAA